MRPAPCLCPLCAAVLGGNVLFPPPAAHGGLENVLPPPLASLPSPVVQFLPSQVSVVFPWGTAVCSGCPAAVGVCVGGGSEDQEQPSAPTVYPPPAQPPLAGTHLVFRGWCPWVPGAPDCASFCTCSLGAAVLEC